jgi:hypothetical protein
VSEQVFGIEVEEKRIRKEKEKEALADARPFCFLFFPKGAGQVDIEINDNDGEVLSADEAERVRLGVEAVQKALGRRLSDAEILSLGANILLPGRASAR